MKNKLYSLLGIISVLSFSAYAQNISTKAGTGIGGFTGDGGQAIAARLHAPAGVALDAAGNVYIADEFNNRIRKVTTAGVISTVVGGNDTAGFGGDGGPATAARLNGPTCVALDAAGNMYIADKQNNRIRKVSAAGIISTIAGTGDADFSGEGDTATQASLNHPNGLCLDGAGNIYIADEYNHRVRKINSAGIITTLVGNGVGANNGDVFPMATMVCLNRPSAVAVSPKGVLYIADAYNDKIRKYDTVAKKVSTLKGMTGIAPYNVTYMMLKRPSALSFDAKGNLYIADEFHYCIKKLDSNGIYYNIGGNMVFGYSGDTGRASLAKVSLVKGIAADSAGNLYFADWDNNRVRYITTTVATQNIAKEASGFMVYPNPAQSGRFTVSITTNTTEKVSVVVTDITGKVVYTTVAETNKLLPVEIVQPTGMYVITAYSADKRWTEKVNIVN